MWVIIALRYLSAWQRVLRAGEAGGFISNPGLAAGAQWGQMRLPSCHRVRGTVRPDAATLLPQGSSAADWACCTSVWYCIVIIWTSQAEELRKALLT